MPNLLAHVDNPDRDLLFLPTQHVVKTISCDAYNSARALFSDLTSLKLPDSDPLMTEVEHAKDVLLSDLARLRQLLQPSPITPRSGPSRARRSVWNILGIASSSDVDSAKKHIALMENKERQYQDHMNQIDRNLRADHAFVTELVKTDEINRILLANKLRRVSLDIAVIRILRPMNELARQVRDHIDTILSGQLCGILKSSPAQISKVLSMVILNDTVFTTAWSSDLRSVNVPVIRDAKCCTAELPGNITRSFNCRDRIFPLRSVIGPDRASVCGKTNSQAMNVLENCDSVQLIRVWCPITPTVAIGWKSRVIHLPNQKIQEVHFYTDKEELSVNLKNYSFVGLQDVHDIDHIANDDYVSFKTFYIVIIPIVSFLLVIALILFSILVFHFLKKKESAARAARVEIALQSPLSVV